MLHSNSIKYCIYYFCSGISAKEFHKCFSKKKMEYGVTINIMNLESLFLEVNGTVPSCIFELIIICICDRIFLNVFFDSTCCRDYNIDRR